MSKHYDALLSSSDPNKLLSLVRGIKARPGLITPMTIMVLAIRLYDVGLRDESVFWFYAAKKRLMKASDVLDFNN